MTKQRFDIFTELLHTGIGITDNNKELTGDAVVRLLNEQTEDINKLIQIKNQYKGQRDYLLFVIERACSKETFEDTKSYLIKVEDNYEPITKRY